MKISMTRRSVAAIFISAVIVVLDCTALVADPSPGMPEQIRGKTYRIERAFFVSVHVPTANVDKVLAAVSAAVGLEYGRYDQVAYLDAEGFEQFRPMKGSKAGEFQQAERVPSRIVRFSLLHDVAILNKALDAIYAAHSYEEPVIYVTEVWRSRSTSPDDTNPNRWWNQKPQ